MQFCLFLSLVFSIDLISILTLFQTYIIQIQCSDGTTGKCNCIYREGNSLKSNTTDTGWTGERCEIPPSLGTYSCLNQNCKKRVGKGAEERGGNLTIGIIRAKNVKDMDTLPGTQVSDPYAITIVLGFCVVPDASDNGVGVCYRPFAPATTSCSNDNINSACRRILPVRSCSLRPLPRWKDPDALRPHADCEVLRRTPYIRNTLNPDWTTLKAVEGTNLSSAFMNFGPQTAGTPIRIQLWDFDAGFELGDDEITVSPGVGTSLMAKLTPLQWVPACSSLDNTLRFPSPGLCIERFWIPLDPDAPADTTYCTDELKYPKAMCLLIETRMEAFGVTDEKTFLIAATSGTGAATYRDVGVSAAVPACAGLNPPGAGCGAAEAPESVAQRLGRVYANSEDMVYAEGITSAYNNFREASGGLLFQTSTEDRSFKGEKYAQFQLTHGAEIFLFRSDDDYQSRNLTWVLRDNYVLDPLIKMQFRSAIGANGRIFRGLRRSIMKAGLLEIGGNNNLSPDYPVATGIYAKSLDTTPYVVVARMHQGTDDIPVVYNKEFDAMGFLSLCIQFGVANVLYAILVGSFLQEIQLRPECIPAYLVATKSSVENYGKVDQKTALGTAKVPNILGSLFLCFHMTQNDASDPTNLEFRRNLFYAEWIVYIIVSLPFLILVIFGVTCAAIVKPPALGFSLVFVGSSFFLMWLGFRKWDAQGWRMTSGIMRAFQLAYALLAVFLMIAPALDPAVLYANQAVDLFSAACGFFTLNLMPMMAIAFMNDPKLKKSMNSISEAVGVGMKSDNSNKTSSNSADKKKKKFKIKRKKTFAKLVEDLYTVDENMEAFKYSDAGGSLVSGTKEQIGARTRKLYLMSIFILILFPIFISWRGSSEQFTQAISGCLVIVAIDSCFWLRFRGFCEWAPGYTVMLLITTRASVAIFLGEFWMIGAAGAYFIFGVALALDIVNFRFKIMSPYEVGAVAFFGKELRGKDEAKARQDMAAMPEFVLGYMSFIFLVLLLGTLFTTPAGQMKYLGSFPVWIFGIMAFFVVMLVAISVTASRAFMLRASSLYVSNSFFFSNRIKVPELLGIATYSWLIVAGFLVSVITNGYTIFICCVTFPIITVLGITINNTWIDNDFHLLPSWTFPKARVPEEMLDDEEEDDEAEQTGGQSSSGGGTGGGAFGGFALPPLTRSGEGEAGMGGALGDLFGGGGAGLKMPALPMKSTMESNAIGGGVVKKEEEEEDEEETIIVQSIQSKYPRHEKGGWDVMKMTGLQACYKGKLSPTDYSMMTHLILFIFSIFITGMIITAVEEQLIGILFWSGLYTFACSYYCCKKYSAVLEWTGDMTLAAFVGLLAQSAGALYMFVFQLGIDTNAGSSLIVLVFYIYWPLACLTGCAMYRWRDAHYPKKSTALNIILMASPAWFMFFVLIMFWVNIFIGIALILLYLAVGLALIMLRKFKRNGDWLPDSYRKGANYICTFICILSWTVGFFLSDGTFAFFISLGFVCIIIKQIAGVAGWVFARPPAKSAPLYVSQYVFPMYMYDPATNQLIEQTDFGFQMYGVLGTALIWGIFCIIFVNPIGLGVAIVASVLLGVCWLTLTLVSLTPQLLGDASRCVDQQMIEQSISIAKDWFHKRRTIVVPHSAKWRELDIREKREKAMLDRYANNEDDEEDEDEQQDGRTTAIAAATELQNRTRGMAYEDMQSYYNKTRRFDAPFTYKDAMWDAFKTGNGPIAPLLGGGFLYKCYAKCQASNKLKKAKKAKANKLKEAPKLSKNEEEGEEEEGNGEEKTENPEEEDQKLAIRHQKSYVVRMEEGDLEAHHRDMSVTKTYGPLRDTPAMYSHMPDLNDHLDQEFEEETRMIIHFQVLLVLSAFSKMEKETTLFQMFLRENRFKLLANGVRPPANIFRSDSFATIDVSLVANWLIRLTPEQHQRFMQLKERFAAELANREMIRGMEDKMQSDEIAQAHQARANWDWQQGQTRLRDVQNRRAARLANDEEPDEKTPEDVINAREFIQEIRQGNHGGLHQGLYDREEQWIDPEFPHDDNTIGYCEARPLVKSWRPAAGINQDMHMFYDGTDPDDVHQGVLHDGWLLSAIQILAASGGVGDEEVDPLIKNLFMHCFAGTAAEANILSDIGVYGVRLHKNGAWETILVDDYFPCLDDEYKETKCCGVAFAYTTSMEEMWVSLLEKAFAKYYGNYAALQNGFPHFALEDMTGAKSEALSIMQESTGSKKALFWTKLLTYKSNRYLMGAGSVSSDSADKEILDSGLIFGATYVVLDVRAENGYKLLQLRNPPGDHGEWQGDWGDDSELWTRYMQRKLDFSDDEDDGCFWMSFDDFCQSFRTLFVGYHYDKNKWTSKVYDDSWKIKDGTAQGVPSRHNKKCRLNENPQFALEIDRPTDLCITMSQTDHGLADSDPLEAMFILYRPPKPIGLNEAPTVSVWFLYGGRFGVVVNCFYCSNYFD